MSMLRDQIKKEVEGAVARIMTAVRETVGAFATEGALPASPRPARSTAPRAALSAAAMRCRHVDRDKKQCKERSGGPRFHFLCVKHREK